MYKESTLHVMAHLLWAEEIDTALVIVIRIL